MFEFENQKRMFQSLYNGLQYCAKESINRNLQVSPLFTAIPADEFIAVL